MTRIGEPVRPRAARLSRSLADAPRLITLGYAITVYLFFLAVLCYSAGFFADIGIPRSIDQGARPATAAALTVDAALLLLFAVQHTVMARPWFKRCWTRLVPVPAERATFVLGASGALAVLLWCWRPVGGTVWSLSGPGSDAVLAVYAAGWLVALSSTFLISHLDLFGVRQAWLHARGESYSPPPFTERGLYRRIRHPLTAGFVILFWASPVMTVGHLLFAAAATGYILVGITFEEKDLRRSLGADYRSYAARVPALIPAVRRSSR